MRYNSLDKKSNAELVRAFTSLRATISVITLSKVDIAHRSSEELRALRQALPNLVEVNLIDAFGEPTSHPSALALIDDWVKGVHQLVAEVLPPDVLASMVLESNTGVPEPIISSFMRKQKVMQLETQLVTLKLKADELKGKDSEQALYHASNAFHSRLTELINDYCQGTMNYQGFLSTSQPRMEMARADFKQHQEWTELLDNIDLSIKALGGAGGKSSDSKDTFFQRKEGGSRIEVAVTQNMEVAPQTL